MKVKLLVVLLCLFLLSTSVGVARADDCIDGSGCISQVYVDDGWRSTIWDWYGWFAIEYAILYNAQHPEAY